MKNKFKLIFILLLSFTTTGKLYPNPPDLLTNPKVKDELNELAKENKYLLLEAWKKNSELEIVKEEGKLIKSIDIKMLNRRSIGEWDELITRYRNTLHDEEIQKELKLEVIALLKLYGFTKPRVNLQVREEEKEVHYSIDIKKGKPCVISKVNLTFKNTSSVPLTITPGEPCNINVIQETIRNFEKKVKSQNYHKAIINFSHIEYSNDLREGVVHITGYLGSSFSYLITETKNSGLLTKFLWFQYRDHPLDNLKNKYTTDQSVYHKVKEFYLNHGYFDATIEPPKRETDGKDHTTITYLVNPGDHYTLGSITFVGNKSFSKTSLLNLNRKNYITYINSSYSEEEFDNYVENIQAFYFSKGYWDARVQKVSLPEAESKKIHLSIRIKEGKQHLLDQLKIEGNQFFTKEELNLNKFLLTKEAISPDSIQALERHIKDLYREKGFLSTKVHINFIPKRSSGKHEFLDLKVKINEGKIYKISKIYIDGLENMSKGFIRKFLRIKEGNLYSLDEIEKSRQDLLDLGVFDSVHFSKRDKHSLQKGSQLVTVYLDLKESNKGNVAFGPGYDIRTGFLYDFEIFYKNPFGLAHKYLLTSSVSEEKNQPFISDTPEDRSHRVGTTIGFSHQNPFFFHKNISQQFTVLYKRGAFTDEGSSLWVTTKDFKLQFELNLRFILDKASIFTNFHYLESLEEGKASNRIALLSIPNTTYSIFGLGFKIDYRDSPSLPQTGFYLETSLDLANTLFLGDYFYLKSKVLFSSYYKFVENFVFAFHYLDESFLLVERKSHGGYEKFIPRAQRLFINTADKVRGFKTDLGAYSIQGGNSETNQALGGTKSLVYKFELRLYKILSIFGLTLFLDGGSTFFSNSEAEDINAYYAYQNSQDSKNNFAAKDLDLHAGISNFFTDPLNFFQSQYHSTGLSINLALPIGVLNFSLSYPISEPKKTTWSRIDDDPLRNFKFDFNIGTTF